MDHFANIASIAGFLIAFLTLCATLNIRGKIDRSLGKQRFLQQREKLVAQLSELRTAIRCVDGSGDCTGLDDLLLNLRELILQLSHYRIWRIGDRVKFKQYISFISKAYNGEKQCSCKEHIMRIDEIVAMVKAQAEV